MLGETWSYKPSCPDYIFLGSPLQAYICLFGPNFFCQTPLQLADPTELVVAVLYLSGRCLKGARRMSEGCLDSSFRGLENIWRVSKECLNGVCFFVKLHYNLQTQLDFSWFE